MNLFYALLLAAFVLAAVLIPLHFLLKALPMEEQAAPRHEEKKRGVSTIEYALIAAGIALAIVSAVNHFGAQPAVKHDSARTSHH
jgi:hypothetical protein